MGKCLCARVCQAGFSVAQTRPLPGAQPFLTSQPPPTPHGRQSRRPLSPRRCTGAAARSPLLCLGGEGPRQECGLQQPVHAVWLWGCRNSTSPPLGGAPGLPEGGRKGWEALCASLDSTGEKAGFPREGKFNLGAWLGASISGSVGPTSPQATLALPTPGRRRCCSVW